MALACQYQYMKVQIGTVDFTGYLSNTEQTATMPAGAEVGRATLTFRDDGSMPAIPKWGTVVISSGTAAPGTPVWGGYATRQSSEPFSMHGGTVRMVTVDCQSYAIALTTTAPITETFGGGDYDAIIMDTAIVSNLVQAYLPAFYDAGSISSASPVQCDYIQFSEETLRSTLNKIEERSAKDYGITAAGKFYYRPRSSGGYSEHKLSDVPNYSDTWPMQTKPYNDIDDVEVRNAVRVVGGWTLSAVQDETFTTDGIAYSFVVNYFPQDIIRVTLANIVLSVGVYLVDPPADFDVLVHYDQRKFIFQLPPGAGKTLEIEYRYPVRVEETVTDAASIAEVGGTIWGPTIQDSSISQATVAQLIGSAYLARATKSNERGQLTTTWAGTVSPYLPGQIIQVYTQALGWDEEELEIQAVTMRFAPRPGGNGVCLTYWDLDVGRLQSFGHTLGGMYQDAPEVRAKTFAPNIRGAITAGDVPTLDHGTALTGLGDDDHPQYLLATGTRTGASSQAQTFTNGIIGPTWKPASDSTTALILANAAGSAKVTIDTTNGRLGIGNTPAYPLDVTGPATVRLPVRGTNAYFTLTSATATAFNTRLGTTASNQYGWYTNLYYTGSVWAKDDATRGAWNMNQLVTTTDAGSAWNLAYYPVGTVTGINAISVIGTSTGANFVVRAGYIGVNTAAPTSNIHSTSANGVDNRLTFVQTSVGTWTMGMPAYTDRLDIGSGADLTLPKISIDANGRLGVNTTYPVTPLHANVLDTNTATIASVSTISHDLSSGTAVKGFGADLSFTLKSTTTNRLASRIVSVWDVATDAAYASDLILYVSDYGAEREGFRLHTTGTAVALAFWGSGPATKQTLAAYTTDPENAAYTGINNAQAGTPYAQLADLNALRTAYENLRAMVDDLRTKLQTTTLVA